MQWRNNPGARIALSGQIAARVSSARQYLVGNNGVPAASVLESVAAMNARFVQVTLVLPPAPPGLPPPGHHHLAHEGSAIPPAPEQGTPAHQVPAQPLPPTQLPQPPAPHPGPGPIVHPPPHDPYTEGDDVHEWEKRLKSGAIDYNSPETLVVNQSQGVVVVIHGYQDPTHSNIPGVAPQGALKVSDRMRVDLDAPLNPGEFTISPAKGAELPVQIDGSATWTFQVTPLNETSEPQTLVIHPYLLFPGKYGALPMPDRTFTVKVAVVPFWQHMRDLWKDDPIKVVKYFLPGGQGWSGMGAFLTGLIALLTSLGVIAWIRRKMDGRDNAAKEPADIHGGKEPPKVS